MTPESRELPLADQLVVFTGKLSSLGRKEAQALVIRLGGSTADEVTSRTTLVVVGAEAGPNAEKSQKQRKAEELGVRVITENDFCRMAGIQPPEDLKQQYSDSAICSACWPPHAGAASGPRRGAPRRPPALSGEVGLDSPRDADPPKRLPVLDLLLIRQVSAELGRRLSGQSSDRCRPSVVAS